MAIKAVIFDCFGVLVKPGRTLLYQVFPQFGVEVSDIEHQWHIGMLSRDEFNQKIAELIGATPEEVKSRYYDISVRDENSVEWLKSLHKEGKYKLGFLSNVGAGRMNDFFDEKQQRELFDQVVLSYEVGMVKPEVAIYDLMAKMLGLKNEECVMIDDQAVNIDAARNSGMQAIMYISVDQTKAELAKLVEELNA